MVSYEEVRQKFESRWCQIVAPKVFVNTLNENESRVMSYTRTQQCNGGLTYEEAGKKKPFWPRYLKDVDAQKKQGIVMDPQGLQPDSYNIWRPFKIQPRAGADIQPILHHVLSVLCGDKQEVADTLLQWLARIIRNPHQRSDKAVVVMGEHSSGKSVLIDWVMNCILGPHCTFKSYTATYPDRFGGIILAHLDSASGLKDVVKIMEKDTVTFDGAVHVANTMNFFVTITQPRKLRPDIFISIQSTSNYAGNREYFKNFELYLKNTGVAESFMEYLFKLPAHPGQIEPDHVTENIDGLSSDQIEDEIHFLSAIVNDNKIVNKVASISATDLIKMFRKWCLNEKITPPKTKFGFGRQIAQIKEGIKIFHDKRTTRYYFSVTPLKRYLIQEGIYNRDTRLNCLL